MGITASQYSYTSEKISVERYCREEGRITDLISRPVSNHLNMLLQLLKVLLIYLYTALINSFPETIPMNATERLSAYLVAVLKHNVSANAWSQASWTLLRVVAGLVMIHNGLDKLSDIQSFADAYVSVIGLPFPVFFSYCAAYTELIGSVLLAIGLLTRPAAAGLVATMLVAMYHHVLVAGFSIPYLELSMLYAACFQLFLVNGGGQYSIDALLANRLNALTTKSVLTTLAQQREQSVQSLQASYQMSESEDVKAAK